MQPVARGRWPEAPIARSTAAPQRPQRADAETWLGRQRADIVDGVIRPQAVASRETLRAYSGRSMDTRRNARGEPLRPSTARVYRHYLANDILPALGDLALPKIERKTVERWHADLLPEAPTLRARTYSFLRTLLGSAEDEGLIPSNPCHIRGAGGSRPAVKPQTASPAQVVALAEQMPERLALAVLLGAWCQVGSGEALALRRKDVTPERISVTRGVTWADGVIHVGPPKTDAGIRMIAVPPHIWEAIAEHLERWANSGPDGLLFPARPGVDRQMYGPTFADVFKRAVRRTDLPEIFRFHWLRHSGLTLAAQSGATLGELQARAGHSTPGIALRYQHSSADRDERLAQALSARAGESRTSIASASLSRIRIARPAR